MPNMHVKRSITINAPADAVFPVLNDFNHWTQWSPWLIMEPGVRVQVSDQNKYYEWEGERVGSGTMSVRKEEKDHFIDYDLTFLKPWKSKSIVRFELSPENGHTRVDWYMDSKLPFFLFWMKRSMEAYVGMDYDRGLMLLKDYVEDGNIHSRLEFRGISEFKGLKYLGLRTACTISEVGISMQRDFEQLEEILAEHPGISTNETFSIYHDWDLVKGTTEYTVCMGISDSGADFPEPSITGEIPPVRIYSLRHIGPYRHLGNAWSTLMNMDRNKEFKKRKDIHPFEQYINDPSDTDENDLITDIHFPIK